MHGGIWRDVEPWTVLREAEVNHVEHTQRGHVLVVDAIPLGARALRIFSQWQDMVITLDARARDLLRVATN